MTEDVLIKAPRPPVENFVNMMAKVKFATYPVAGEGLLGRLSCAENLSKDRTEILIFFWQ